MDDFDRYTKRCMKRMDDLYELMNPTYGELRSFNIANESFGVTAEQFASMSKVDRMKYLNDRNKKIYAREIDKSFFNV